MRIIRETKLQSPRKHSAVDDESTRLVVTNTVKELDLMRRELHNIKRDLNLEIMQFTTSFNQLLSAVHSLANIEKTNKATKKIEQWQIKLQCKCIKIVAVPVAPVTVKISKLSMLRSHEEWFTYMFYSHESGYRLCLRVLAAGFEDARGTSVSVFVQHMDETNVDHLAWPMEGTITAKLMNQIKDKHHHFSTITYNKSKDRMCAGQVTSHGANGMGEPHFIGYDELFRSTAKQQFVSDDSIYIEITFNQL
ncbi:TNF receptor-associated factor 5-like [Dysidea avara]|uniref:TNF receptor-associated factor 5-like n=1 Tax=Dysidea avara TaxID=196820 RepID=UPI0033297034